MTKLAAVSADEELKALVRRVRQIELRARKAVNAAGQGAYASRFKGRGMAFVESRAYAPGDDPRHIDWNASARTGELFVKQFVEERELTVLLSVDLSGSMSTGSRARTKRQVAAEALALLAFSALRNNDKVGLVAFTDRIERLVRPKKGRAHVMRLVRDVLSIAPQGRSTDLAAAITTTTHLSKQRAVVALVTDLLACPLGTPEGVTLEKQLKVLARRHDLLVIEVCDAIEDVLPNAGLVRVRDPESGKLALVDTGDARVRTAYAKSAERQRERVRGALRAIGVERVSVTERESAQALVRFMRRRARKAA